MTAPYKTYQERLDRIKNQHLLRQLHCIDSRHKKMISVNNNTCLNLSSNDYLGLATDETIIQIFYNQMNASNRINEFGLGASSSRLLTGNFALYEKLESKIQELYQRSGALVFNSGYHANIGMIPILAKDGDLILSDSLNHASIIDGVSLSKADRIIFRHSDLNHLADILARERDRYKRVLIITESVFSMDGDLADLPELVKIKDRYEALLYVDEAHSVGVYGKNGLGLCEETLAMNSIDIILGTCGKALASHGAYAVTNRIIKNVLINDMRSLLYTTALPPVVVNWNLYIISRLHEFKHQRKNLKLVSTQFKKELERFDLKTPGHSHILPVLTFDNKKAILLTEKLLEYGFLTYPIRPPTVSENQSRIRISLTSDIDFKDISEIPELILSNI